MGLCFTGVRPDVSELYGLTLMLYLSLGIASTLCGVVCFVYGPHAYRAWGALDNVPEDQQFKKRLNGIFAVGAVLTLLCWSSELLLLQYYCPLFSSITAPP